jgi:hypothetical protein
MKSYDTEALNKQQLLTQPDELLFVNTFNAATHKKITLGVQQLYIIGKTCQDLRLIYAMLIFISCRSL